MSAASLLNRLAPVLAAAVMLFTVGYHVTHPLDARTTPAVPAPAPADAAPASAPAVNFRDIAGWALFGTPPPADAPAGDGPDDGPGGNAMADDAALEDLPPSSLGLQVSGIAYSLDTSRAYAIIGTPDGQQRQYKVGETILDGVTLHAVRPLEVVIANQGRLESVALPLESTGPAAGAAPARLPFATPNLPEFRSQMVAPDGTVYAPPPEGPNP